MPMFKYKKIVVDGPNGHTLDFKNNESDKSIQLGTVEEWTYVFVDDVENVDTQHPEIDFQEVVVDNELKRKIKSSSRFCKVIEDEMQEKIRSKYSLEDEQYFARIGVGAALGVYEFEPGEQDELLAFGQYVESVRAWGRSKRAEIGL